MNNTHYIINLSRIPSKRNVFVAIDVKSNLTGEAYHIETQCKRDAMFNDDVTYRTKNEHAHKSALHYLLLEMREQGFDDERCVNLVWNTLRSSVLRLLSRNAQGLVAEFYQDKDTPKDMVSAAVTSWL